MPRASGWARNWPASIRSKPTSSCRCLTRPRPRQSALPAPRACAAEVHLRICAPPIRYACHLGVDTAPEDTLIANAHTVDDIRRLVGADSLGYLSLAGLVRA